MVKAIQETKGSRVAQSETTVYIEGQNWLINGEPTHAGREYRGWRIEGLLLNSRMANAIFDDSNSLTQFLWHYPDTGEWDPDRNTDEFSGRLAHYRGHGLDAVTVNLQGAAPFGYYRQHLFREMLDDLGVSYSDEELWAGLPSADSQPWHNSPFGADGSLESSGHMDRLTRILRRTNELCMAVVLGIFYFGQDERLESEAAVCRAVDETCRWVLENGWRNVVIEINNECNVQRYEHEILQPHRVHELIARAKGHSVGGERLLVGTSYGGGRVPDDSVCEVSDFLMLHGNGVTDPARIAEMVDETRALSSYTPKPIMFTEDDHFNFDEPFNNFTAALSRGAGWGYFDPGAGAGGQSASGNYTDGYQNVPINWGINTPRKRAFFDLLRKVTGA